MGECSNNYLLEISTNNIVKILSQATYNVLNDFTNINKPPNSKEEQTEKQSSINQVQRELDFSLNYKFKTAKSKLLLDEDTDKDISVNSSKTNSFCSDNDTIDYDNNKELVIAPANLFGSIKNLSEFKRTPSTLKIKLIEISPNSANKEIFNRVNSKDNKDNKEYSIFKGNQLDIDLAEFVNKIVFDFKIAKSTIILAFIYLDHFLNKTKIALANENYKK